MLSSSWLLQAAAIVLIANLLAIWIWRRRRGGQRSPTQPAPDRSVFQTGLRKLTFPLTLLFAAVPATLVIQDRWFGTWRQETIYGSPWCDLGVFCKALEPMPLYIAPILACAAAVFYLVGKQDADAAPFHTTTYAAPSAAQLAGPLSDRQMRISDVLLIIASGGLWLAILAGLVFQRIPQIGYAILLLTLLTGLFLRTFSTREFSAFWSQNRAWIGALLVMFIAFFAFLAQAYGRQSFRWLAAIFLGAALLNVLRYIRTIAPVFWIISLALILNTYELNAWWFSIIGDEYEFYRFARRILEVHGLQGIASRFFDGQGIYGVMPYLSSVIQAGSIGLFGPTNFGWRFSNLFLIALSAGFLYAFLERFTRPPIPLLGAGLISVSHYLMTFGKIGYNNPQALFALSVALWSAAQALRRPNVFWFAVCGVSLGACFYVFPMAVFSVPVVLLLLWLFRRQIHPSRAHWAAMALAAGLTIYPLLLQPGYWGSKIFGVFISNPEIMSSAFSVLAHLTTNAFYSLIAFIIIPEETHFVAVSLADPLSSIFILLGLAWLVRHGRSHPFGIFSLTSYALLLLLVGVVHGTLYPSNTRMFLLVPFYGLLAAFGVVWTANKAGAGRWPRWLRSSSIAAIMLAIIGTNLYQAYTLSKQRVTVHQSFQMLSYRLAESILRSPEGAGSRFVLLGDAVIHPRESLLEMLALYQVPHNSGQVQLVELEDTVFTDADQATLEASDSLVILHPGVALPQQVFVANWMQTVGKTHCDARNLRGEFLFRVWYAPDRTPPCEALY